MANDTATAAKGTANGARAAEASEPAGLTLAKLRSERVRIVCMVLAFSVFASIGLLRVVSPVEEGTIVGWVLLVASLVFIGLEAAMFRTVTQALGGGRAVNQEFVNWLGVAECLFPIFTTSTLMTVLPETRFTALVSPAYAFLLVLVAVSVLRVDVQATVVTGLIAVIGYGWLVVAALAKSDLPPPNPHPTAMYVALWGMVVLASVAAAFVAWQVREYVLAAVREVETRRQRDHFKRDLEIAGDIQRQLLPREMPSVRGYDFAAFSRPADASGGDYFDWQALGAARVVLSVGDVSGHGIGPALVTAACRSYVRAVLPIESNLAAALEHTNDLLRADMPDGRFVTLSLADLDSGRHMLRLLSAGHGPTFYVRGGEGAVSLLDSQGMPLGPFDDLRLDAALELPLAPGDLVLLCSDGIYEAANPAGETFGVARVGELLEAHRATSATEILSTLQAEVDRFTAGATQLDDITAVAIKRVG